ncbi:MAG: hypothetical protein KDA84_14870 [Planctomycetaceae bacterium]|nr:hypothetical protein [Planctomycetaceae bacterium]
MSVHRIRLRGPWQFEWLSPTNRNPAEGRASLPQEWRELFGTEPGQVRFLRKFNRPTNLDQGSHVDVVFEGVGGFAKFAINGQSLEPLPTDGSDVNSIRCRITDDLEPSNELQVDLHFDPSQDSKPGGLWGLVVLEIVE